MVSELCKYHREGNFRQLNISFLNLRLDLVSVSYNKCLIPGKILFVNVNIIYENKIHVKMHPGGNCLLLLCTITCMYFDYIHDQVNVYTYSYAAMLILQLSLFMSVPEFTCHEGGASAIVYSSSTQRLVTGGRKGEICILYNIHTSHMYTIRTSTTHLLVIL